jgi:hypothetical protein
MQTVDAVGCHVDHIARFGQAVLQVLAGFRFVFDDQNSHIAASAFVSPWVAQGASGYQWKAAGASRKVRWRATHDGR